MILQDFVKCGDKAYEVNSVSMNALDQLLNPMMALRNEMFGIDAIGETMIWAVDGNKVRLDPILHCQRYRKITSMKRNHTKAVNRLNQGKSNFFNGDGFPFNK